MSRVLVPGASQGAVPGAAEEMRVMGTSCPSAEQPISHGGETDPAGAGE